MLRTLEIHDMLIIDRLELNFHSGLNVLTGETGAGKSILLDSLGFVLGWRGRAELVRNGANQGEVTAVFDLSDDHPAHVVLNDAGLPGGDELILRRINTKDGRKTAWVNDRRCSGDVLRRLGDTLIELHGQQDDRGLLNPRGHRLLLDSFGNLDTERLGVRTAWRTMANARHALDTAEADLAKVRDEEEFLRHAVGELDALDPKPGEDADLDSRRRLMQASERIRTDIAKAYRALGSEGAEGAASDALRWLEDASTQADGQLDAAIAAVGRAMVELDDAARGVSDCIDALQFNPLELEEAEERLFAIRALARKHDVTADELGTFAQGLRARITALDQGDADVAVLQDALNKAKTAYDVAAKRLSAARSKSAKSLDASVMIELAPLKMERAVFQTAITPTDPGPDGLDEVAFRVATNPGAPSGPLAKIASGGELSRFLLALKVCLTEGQSGLTLIFDEIDRGVGGATADAVGRRLAQLAEGGQVLVVTHSPQVASLAAHHWRVQKHVTAGQTLSTVTDLAPPDRIDEIARMLSGDTITPEARAAAQVLMAG